MLIPPVAQTGTGDRPVDDTSARVHQASGPTAATTLWPLAPPQSNQIPNQQSQGIPPLASTPTPAHNQGVNRYGLYSLFPGAGGGSYVAATPATPGPLTPARAYHATTHKVSESVFSAAVGVGVGGYTWGAPTPPPGSPYSPVPVTQLELLAKNLASLAPSGQQALSLQGVGVNVGSLHHAQHTQHTQQTLNLTGLHHLHHGGLHQNTFSPQLSLMTGNAPTLTINSFSSPNSTGNVVPTTGVLLQEYQSPTDSSTGCSVSMNGTSCPTSSTTSTMIVQGGQADTQVVQATGKKREAFLSSQGQPVKLENKPTMLPCVCRNSSGKTKPVHSDAGCSRTLPVASSWNGQDASNSNNNNGSNNLVKRESLAKVPCQVAEVSTSLHATTTSVKIEPVPPKSENGIVVSNTGTSGVPVGIAVARQRLQHQETSTSMRNVSLSHHSSHHASYHHFQPDSLGTSAAMAVGGATLVHCGIPGGEDRPAHVAIPSGALASSLNAATFTSSLNSSLNSTLGSIGATASAGTAATAATAAATTAWPQTLWQYPATAAAAAAAAAAAMPMEPVGFPQMGVGLQGGLQLVRDPSTGHLLLIHAAEQMQQAVVWPNYSSHNNGNIVPPPLLLPPPPPSLQFLGDIGGARLVLTENKRKQQNTLPIVKIETDCGTTPTTIITSTESTKALQTVTSMTGTLVPDTTPLVTTLHYYPHAPALVQISQSEPTPSRSQATSPVSCLTPPPEVTTIHAIEPPEVMVGVQDASNQTDAPEPELEQEPSGVEVCVKQEQSTSPCHQQNSGKLTTNTTMNMTNLANYEVMTASPEKVCNVVRITTTTTTMNPTVCNVIKKVDKAENTIINMADCPKYSITNECRTVTSIDRTIEHVVTKDMDREHKNRTDAGNENPEMFGRERVANKNIRTGPHIIEITEENCDSFHENLELFGQRRDHSSEWHRDKTRYYTLKFASNEHQEYTKTETEEHIETEPPRVKGVAFTKVSERENCGTSVNETEVPSQELLIETKATTESKCDSCTKNLDDRPQAPLPQLQIAAKSFDMPNIDCEKETIEPIVVKQEADETAYEFCSYRCDVTSTTEKTKCQESLKRHAIEKSHPGIENVVEKLKKNAAAALQDSAHEKIDNSKDKNVECLRSRKYSEATPRKLENGLKKLILKSCENTQFMDKQDISLESQVSSIEVINADLDSRNISKKSTTIHTSHSELQRHMLNDNNNDIKSSNNNIKDVVDEKFAVKRENLSDACQESDTKIMCDTEQQHRRLNITQDPYAMMANNQSGKSRKIVTSKQKPVADRVDISGLELLSNSIEQLEHLNPGAQNTSDISESEISSIEGKIITLNQENNNNSVDSPLGLLCALAEQRFMEEVGDRIPRKLNLESSEEISYAGRLLLNLGKINLLKKQEKSSDKRKLSQLDVEHYNDFKRVKIGDEFHTKTLEYKPSHHLEKYSKNINCGTSMHGNGLFKIKEKSHKNVDISEQNGTTIDNDAAIVLHKTTTGRKSPCKSENYEENEPYPLREELDHYQQNDEQTYDKESMFQSNSSDSEMETYSHRESADGQMKNDNATVFKRRFSVTEHTECHDYRNVQAKLDAKKFIAKKGHTDNDTDWPNMDAMELDMRVRLADIQRQYREKQKELSKLTPRKDEKRSPTRPQKKSHNSGSDSGLLSTPPMVESKSSRKSPPPSTDFVPQALSSSVLTMPRCNINLVKLGEPRSHIKLLDNIPSIPIPAPPLSSPITVLPSSKTSQDENERSPSSLNYDTSSPVPTVVNSSSASKKRKVDRPRKLMYTSGSVRHLTEMIVAKKPKSKSSLVGYLLSSKSRHLQAKYVNKAGYTPLPFKTAISSMKSSSKSYKSSKLKSKPAKQTPLHNKNVISSIIAEKAKLNHEIKLDKQNKMKPKLKAETKVKTWQDVESNSIMADTSSETTVQDSLKDIPVDITTSVHLEKELEKNKHEKSKKKKRKSSSSSPFRHKSSDRDKKESKRRKSLECKECKECVKVGRSEKMEIINKCKLTSAHLAIDQLRVLTAMGGLFYAGRLSAVQAPDVYAITLDGERGNRPHIHSREEILRDAIIEVCPTSTKELPPGTRLCAYWSQQYRCLYPGTSVEPSEPDPELDEKFVSVEFDDGDSGRIALDDIRLLQPDYPVVEYDPNPLLSLGKRRRQTSMSTEDKRCSNNSQLFTSSNTTNAMNLVTSTTNCYVSSPGTQLLEQSKSDNMNVKDLDDYRERKRMKKRRRDKLKRLQETQDGKKKHRKHKCCEEHRKHKHRKHRKHKHKHHGNHSDGSHISSGDSSCGQKSEEDLPKEEMVQTAEEEVKKELSTQMEIIPKTIEPICEETEKTEKPKKADKKTKMRERQESVESRSKMAAFLPARQLWGWAGKGYRRPGAKGRAKKQFFRAIQRGNETIQIGDSAVFLSTGRPDRPYIGRIESMWETSSSNMIVKVKWFYHPEETVGCPENLKYPGALFESPHMDENDVQTISHKCEVLPLQEYTEKLGKEPHRYLTIYDNNDIYYLAGYYDPTTYLLTTQPGVV